MNIPPFHSLWRILYPYLVVARVSTLVLASLAYLVLYHIIRDRLNFANLPKPQKDLQQIN
ncbi:hypothetical protein [Leptolyngbya ohadii]|uniref:hypothetical protein n=1 Tax=Leptolyngbya ohadii TaxID=1962290 RepID=UPI00117BB7B6|nr:hypothetical protein [Leptolyngbya ohadii]